MQANKDTIHIYSAFAFCLILLGFVFYQAQGIEGGLDSWNHYLISRSSFKHTELLLDQWNKPVFTWFTVLICQLGLNALIIFNILCVSISGLLNALSVKKLGYSYTWLIVLFTVFTPILFQNTISGLTEPLNVLMLSLVFYFWGSNHIKTAVLIASFLPFVRTEGFVICGAIFLLIILRKEYKLLLWLIPGSIVMNIVGFTITGKPFWIISENPYWKQETEGTFDPGSGSIFHFVNNSKAMFGLPLLALLLLGIFVLWVRWRNKSKQDDIFSLAFWVFILYFFAHTAIYYLGILGSHGLTRPLAVVAGPLAILAFYALDIFNLKKISKAKYILFLLIASFVIQTAYKEASYAKPLRIKEASVKPDKTQKNFIAAGKWLEGNKLMDRPIIHQSPFFDVYFNRDPYDINSSYRIWSIDQKNDWAAIGVIVIWDGFSAVREGNMKKEWLLENKNYKLLHTIEGFEKPDDNPEMYKVLIFEKVN